MKSFSKIDLKDVSWWKSIKNACKPKALETSKLSKERCISLVTKGRPARATLK